MNPANWLYRSARLTPEAPALLKGQAVVANYQEFDRRAARIGSHLSRTLGIKSGDRVAVLMKNSTEYLEALYGIWYCGAVAVPINAKLHVKEAAWIIENAGAKLAFVSNDIALELPALASETLEGVVAIETSDWIAMFEAEPFSSPAAIASDELIWLFYTSGTTGKPKGVMITAGNLTHMTLAYFSDVDEVRPEDAILYAAPMSHGAGIYNFMHVIKGARHVVPESGGFEPTEIFDLASKVRNISMFAAPTMVKRLVDVARVSGQTGDGIKTVTYAGGPMYLSDIQEAVDVLGDRFVQIYGQGECPMGITALERKFVSDRTHPRWRERLGSVGVAQSPVLVDIFDEMGCPLPAGEIGEIVVKGPTVMKGYWNNPEATKKTIKDGWLWTGDMGAMDEDGFVTMHDRSKDMIISGGSNIYPREVEEVLLEHAGVSEVAVVGKKHPEWGEVVVAFVVPSALGVEAATLDAYCVENIARFKRPKEYRLVTGLPKNNYGKVLKTELRGLLSEEVE